MSASNNPGGGRKKALFGVGALMLMLFSCGVGAVMGTDETSKIADEAPATVTVTETVSGAPAAAETVVETRISTVTETPTTTPARETPAPGRRAPEAQAPVTTETSVPVYGLVNPNTTTDAPASSYYDNCDAARAAGAAPCMLATPVIGQVWTATATGLPANSLTRTRSAAEAHVDIRRDTPLWTWLEQRSNKD